MFTTIIHPIRKALCLSCNEYIVLDQVYRLSHNDKYGSWCVASKAKIAEWLDLSEKTVFRAIEKLIAKELISKDNQTGWIKTTDAWNEQIANSGDWAIAFNGKETQYISAKVKSANVLPSVSLSKPFGQSVLMGSVNMTDNNKSKHIELHINNKEIVLENKTDIRASAAAMLLKFFRGIMPNDIAAAKLEKYMAYNKPEYIIKSLNNSACIGETGLIKCLNHYKNPKK